MNTNLAYTLGQGAVAASVEPAADPAPVEHQEPVQVAAAPVPAPRRDPRRKTDRAYQRRDAWSRIQDVLRDASRAMGMTEIAKAAGLPPPNVWAALRYYAARGRIEQTGEPRRWRYRLVPQ